MTNPNPPNDKKKESNPQLIRCQKCLEHGHWTFQCKGKRKILHRSTRSLLLQKRVKEFESKCQVQSINVHKQNLGLNSKNAAKRRKEHSSESSNDDSDADQSSSLDSSESSSSELSSDSSDSSSSSTSSSSSSSSSSSESDSTDDESDSNEEEFPTPKKVLNKQ